MRALADYQNLLRETEKKQKEIHKYANAKIFANLLPILENLRQMYVYIPEESKKLDWVIGLHNIQKQLDEFLAQNQVSRIATLGQQFDPARHEAVGSEAEPTKKDGEVLKEVKAGFEYHGEVICPAMVIINTLRL